MLLNFGFHNSRALLQALLQLIQNLLGMSTDPTMLTGDSMNQDDSLRHSINTENQRLFLCYIFNETAESLEMSKKCFQHLLRDRRRCFDRDWRFRLWRITQWPTRQGK